MKFIIKNLKSLGNKILLLLLVQSLSGFFGCREPLSETSGVSFDTTYIEKNQNGVSSVFLTVENLSNEEVTCGFIFLATHSINGVLPGAADSNAMFFDEASWQVENPAKFKSLQKVQPGRKQTVDYTFTESADFPSTSRILIRPYIRGNKFLRYGNILSFRTAGERVVEYWGEYNIQLDSAVVVFNRGNSLCYWGIRGTDERTINALDLSVKNGSQSQFAGSFPFAITTDDRSCFGWYFPINDRLLVVQRRIVPGGGSQPQGFYYQFSSESWENSILPTNPFSALQGQSYRVLWNVLNDFEPNPGNYAATVCLKLSSSATQWYQFVPTLSTFTFINNPNVFLTTAPHVFNQQFFFRNSNGVEIMRSNGTISNLQSHLIASAFDMNWYYPCASGDYYFDAANKLIKKWNTSFLTFTLAYDLSSIPDPLLQGNLSRLGKIVYIAEIADGSRFLCFNDKTIPGKTHIIKILHS